MKPQSTKQFRWFTRCTATWLILAILSVAASAAQLVSTSPVVIAVAPNGSDDAQGTPEHPFKSLERAQQAVRRVNATRDVTIQLGDGIYRLACPLVFTAQDGGRNDHHVLWTAAPD